MTLKEDVQKELTKLVILYKSPVTTAYKNYILVQIQLFQWILQKIEEYEKPKSKKVKE